MQKGNEFRVHVRHVFKRIFYVLLDRLKIRRFGDHLFFSSLLPRSAIVADFGAHRGQFFCGFEIQLFDFSGASRRGESSIGRPS